MKSISESARDTMELAANIAARLKGGETLLLSGRLGAGKTTFTKGLAEALGIKKSVVSPTFTIIREYGGGRLKLYHIDMYRIEDTAELSELGIEDCFSADSVVVIEWNKLPDPQGKIIEVIIEPLGGDKREITVEGL
ncbi:MAG: tRNA (adenosine(37)-N6)-threonylcarbamoyltransferase complex ATPase subunit type 1 TsaE [Clostridiales bacterium]|jgi:tRNA threonylcarbamoyladenosine biosynthesis protein TsaE|nr:tRNA (adenosine(37)-N6)-threonylcarbamoyltransferase complex ATPase subunit type 1 TsaE [Clostridiales bacterium]HOB64079.1 tRNA (adenosine(37)-N6)-threonylcarbamoyltransferase complex ATPase subunit type 1 TsaE [Clostridia bacterium]HOK81570.1 tRNA (adenosine(37)-N6)-threonylcarbamoyltransferase complex ATPase subunit type 1 TsaE [Clostridia bacterium]HOL61016.1 tRNA (adenosine(37)-N6)-threonylcarbamoyltransferase complex ATPase subunit type 1 TsaE [Clostridia bacterium]HPO53392.1 tRNA (ade